MQSPSGKKTPAGLQNAQKSSFILPYPSAKINPSESEFQTNSGMDFGEIHKMPPMCRKPRTSALDSPSEMWYDI